MKHLQSFFLSVALTLLSWPVSAQQGISVVTNFDDSFKQAYLQPEFLNAPTVIHLPVVSNLSDRSIPVVQVFINGEVYRFGFDTGASSCFFNSGRLPEGLKDSVSSMGQILTHDGIAEVQGCFIMARNVDLGELRIKEIVMPAVQGMDMPTDLDGIIGLGLVYDYDIYINWSQNEIMLIDPESTDSVLAGRHTLSTTVPINTQREPAVAVVDTKIRGQLKKYTFRLTIDTGASYCVVPGKARPWFGFRKYDIKRTGVVDMSGDTSYGAARLRMDVGGVKYNMKVTLLKFPTDHKFRKDKDGVHGYGALGTNVLGDNPILLSTTNKKLILFGWY